MTTPLTKPQPTKTLDLEATLQTLVHQHGLSAVGNALVQQHGRTKAIAACLGQRPDSTACTSTAS
ncbi:MAG: hypothetical protein AAF773_11940 [Cyanobacteria bacterium P01_D01_bin.115]